MAFKKYLIINGVPYIDGKEVTKNEFNKSLKESELLYNKYSTNFGVNFDTSKKITNSVDEILSMFFPSLFPQKTQETNNHIKTEFPNVDCKKEISSALDNFATNENICKHDLDKNDCNKKCNYGDGTKKELTIDDIYNQKLNIYTVKSFLKKNDGCYAMCINDENFKDIKFKYFTAKDLICEEYINEWDKVYNEGFYEVDDTYNLHSEIPLPNNTITENWKFKLFPIEIEEKKLANEQEEEWIDCSVEVAIKMIEEDYHVVAIKDDTPPLRVYCDKDTIDYQNIFFNAVREGYKFQYLNK